MGCVLQGPSVVMKYDDVPGVCYRAPVKVKMMCGVYVTGSQCCYDDVPGVCYRAPVLLR